MTESLKVHVLGNGTLAPAIRACCAPLFTASSIGSADVVWVAYDTPVSDDVPDNEWVIDRAREAVATSSGRVLVSSQMPVGTVARLEAEFPDRLFACSPENVRAAHAHDDFRHQPRILVGTRNPDEEPFYRRLLGPFTDHLLFMSPETAEMAKHALNAYLALSIVFINEIEAICERVGADAHMVSRAMKMDPRVGPRAYVRPGEPFTGGTLGRDLTVLHGLGAGPLLSAIPGSNNLRLEAA